MPMAFKIENSKVLVQIYYHLKINIQAPVDPYSGPCKFELNQTSSFRVPST